MNYDSYSKFTLCFFNLVVDSRVSVFGLTANSSWIIFEWRGTFSLKGLKVLIFL